jgi:hypothetical protein
MYDPDLGRFITADPQRFRPALYPEIHPYVYVADNTVGFADPTGFRMIDAEAGGPKQSERAMREVARDRERAERAEKSHGIK